MPLLLCLPALARSVPWQVVQFIFSPLSLVWFARRHKRGEWVPDWVKPLVIS